MENQRQFRLRCSHVTNTERAYEWSSSYVMTVETGRYEIILDQPEAGSEKLKPLQCPNCGEMLKVTIRSEADARKRGFFLWTAVALSFLIAAGLFIVMAQSETDALLLGSFICACLSAVLGGIFLYFALPSQLRATIYDNKGDIILPMQPTEVAGHELEEIRSAG